MTDPEYPDGLIGSVKRPPPPPPGAGPAANMTDSRERQHDVRDVPHEAGDQSAIWPPPPDRDCYTLPNGECAALMCPLHGPAFPSTGEPTPHETED
jgi:hypothetical protein